MLDKTLGAIVEAFKRRKRVYRYRSSITGRMVSRAYADANPQTTTREEVR